MTRVLIVDDNLFVRTLLREMLEEGGHLVVGEAPDGIDALSRVGMLAPELVILDLVIPRRAGLATLECLSTEHPALPVIICSAGLTHPRVVEALRLGARAFIAKPFTLSTVLDTVTNVMQEAPAVADVATVTPPSTVTGPAREERRGFPRVKVSLPVVLTPDAGPSVSALTTNISGGGMLLTSSPLAQGAVVQFALEVDPHEPPITGCARAVREQTHTQQALAFENVSLVSHVRLTRFIDSVRDHAAHGGRRDQRR